MRSSHLSGAWKRKRRRPKLRFKDSVKNVARLSIARVVREAQDKDNWRRFCKGTTADRLNDLTVVMIMMNAMVEMISFR